MSRSAKPHAQIRGFQAYLRKVALITLYMYTLALTRAVLPRGHCRARRGVCGNRSGLGSHRNLDTPASAAAEAVSSVYTPKHNSLR